MTDEKIRKKMMEALSEMDNSGYCILPSDAKVEFHPLKKMHPMLFNEAMVQAILKKTKTQTRREIKDIVIDENSGFAYYKRKHMMDIHSWKNLILEYCPYGKIGDLIWVRETFAPVTIGYKYRADGVYLKNHPAHKWIPSIHMPLKAARIWLEIVNVRVERVQDISESDAQAEGVIVDKNDRKSNKMHRALLKGIPAGDYQIGFINLWGQTKGGGTKGLEAWNANPYVWVITIREVKNITVNIPGSILNFKP